MTSSMLPGEDDLVVMAALYDLPRMDILDAEDEADARFLADVKRRYEAHVLAKAQEQHAAWIRSIQP